MFLPNDQNSNGTAQNIDNQTDINSTGDKNRKIIENGSQPLSKVSEKNNDKSISGKKHVIHQAQKKDSDLLSVPNKVLGESSLILNEALESSDSIFSSVPLWCYTGIFGAGILLLSSGFKMSGKSVNKEKSEMKDEEENS